MAKDGSVKKRIYEQVFQKIVNSEFPLDEFLVEGKLAEMFSVSRAPVREALVELCNEGLLRSIPRAGYQIVQLSRKDLRDALELRLILETEAIKLACDRLDAETISRLEALRRGLGSTDTDAAVGLYDWMKRGSLMHLTIAELSGNRFLYEKVKEVHDLIRRATVQIYLERDWRRREQPWLHEKILDAMLRRDTDKAVELLRRDIDALREILQQA